MASNEIQSMRMTVAQVLHEIAPNDLEQIVLYLAPHVTEDCRAMAAELSKQIPKVQILQQVQPGLWHDIQQYLRQHSQASHFLLAASDGEMADEAFGRLVEGSREKPAQVVKFSRFMPGGGFSSEHGPLLQLATRVFGIIGNLLYGAHLSDFTYGVGSIPLQIFLAMYLETPSYAGVMEHNLISLRMHLPIEELPVHQVARFESYSGNSIFAKFLYIIPLLKLRVAPQDKLFRTEDAPK
ncbi:MAG: hypothetical protein LBN05_03725 [Oscillospiraceae bacterium]|nr:hypothetical protein [Oscillospiraceae bacterium]